MIYNDHRGIAKTAVYSSIMLAADCISEMNAEDSRIVRKGIVMFGKAETESFTEQVKRDISTYQEDLRYEQNRTEQFRSLPDNDTVKQSDDPKFYIPFIEEQIRCKEFELENYTDAMAAMGTPTFEAVTLNDMLCNGLRGIMQDIQYLRYAVYNLADENKRKRPRARKIREYQHDIQQYASEMQRDDKQIIYYLQMLEEDVIDKQADCPLYDFADMMSIAADQAEELGYHLQIGKWLTEEVRIDI